MARPDESFVRAEIVVAARQHLWAYRDFFRHRDPGSIASFLDLYYRALCDHVDLFHKVQDEHLGILTPRAGVYNHTVDEFCSFGKEEFRLLLRDDPCFFDDIRHFWDSVSLGVVRPEVPSKSVGPFCINRGPGRCLYDYNFALFSLETPRIALASELLFVFDIDNHPSRDAIADAAITTYENILLGRNPIFP